ncbi:MAG: methionine--tRNA ligase [Candidatus Pacebacteria bacterium]|nr:methionine--tRNA ligase [Candidatus Paceibacterota bacterium]
MSARYLTTTLPYVNADPHIGFALEAVQADVLARVWRAAGDEVFFSMGTDEHGQKILEAAQKAGQEPQAYVDHYAAEFHKLKDALNLTNDRFIRTTDPEHLEAAQEMWRRCAAKGDVYKKTYTGLYCVGCEAFKTEKELVDGTCPLHPNGELTEVSEENYFFRFSKYEKELLAYLERPEVLIPEWRRIEAINFVKGGLEDFSISREASRASWGIPVPDDDSQVMYVWFDALTNYISTLGWPEDTEGNFKKFWEEGTTLQIAGKDQLRFQSLMWQAMLMSAEIKNTDSVFYHGFITSGGAKMSKSIGNVINPLDLVEQYGTDAVRYLLLRHVSPVEDSDLTLEAIHDHYTAHLTNGLGNLVARVMQLAETYLQNPVSADAATPEPIVGFKFNEAMDAMWARISAADLRITAERPFVVVKENPEEGKRVITELVQELYRIGASLRPYMPATAEKILQAVQENKKPENLFPRL